MNSFQLKRWRRRLRPTFVRAELQRIGRKLSNRITRPYSRQIHLPAVGERRGRALVSFWIDPFLLPPGKPIPIAHTHFWESQRIAITWTELGYDTDVIHWTNERFEPSHDYDVFVDVRVNMERLGTRLGDSCLKIQHIETGHYLFHNRAQRQRLENLEARRGARIRPVKLIEENRAIETADFATTTGNEFTMGTYAHAGRKILHVPISAPHLYPSPASKDFAGIARNYLWFGSGGLVHKGLDLVLEAFAGLPQHHLYIVGPIEVERDFEREYARELYGLDNVHTIGWMHNGSPEFQELIDRCAGLIYPSCSEGGGGSVITCLHAGLIPVLTYEASVDVDDFGVILPDAEIGTIRAEIERVSSLPAATLRDMAVGAWTEARIKHTREGFAGGYRAAVEEILGDWEKRRG